MSSFTEDLSIRKVGSNLWDVIVPLVYHVGSEDSAEYVTVPIGSRTNFGSIPRLFWSLFPPIGSKADKAYVLHDWLYRTPEVRIGQYAVRRITRQQADDILNEALGVLKVNRVTRWIIYHSVRLRGQGGWDRYRAAELAAA